jgi:hypothetical protein
MVPPRSQRSEGATWVPPLRELVRTGLNAGGNWIRTIGPSLEQIVCLASRTVAIGEKIREPDGRKAFAESYSPT